MFLRVIFIEVSKFDLGFGKKNQFNPWALIRLLCIYISINLSAKYFTKVYLKVKKSIYTFQ